MQNETQFIKMHTMSREIKITLFPIIACNSFSTFNGSDLNYLEPFTVFFTKVSVIGSQLH